MKKLLPYLTVFILFLCITIPLSANNGFIETKNGLAYKDLKIGQDGEAQLGDTATIHFIGWLDDKGQRGREIYNSRKEKKAVSFVIGTDKVLQGWNEGVIGMRKGGSRLLRVPPVLAYGDRNIEDVIPPQATLLFVIELIDLN